MNRQIRTLLEWLHVTILLAPVSTLLYHMIYMDEKTYDNYWLYVQAWSLLLPVILSALLVSHIKSLAGYLLAGVGVTAVVCVFHWLLGPFMRQNSALVGNVVIMGLLTVVIWLKRFGDRLRTAEDRQEEDGDPFWTPADSFLNRVSLSGLGLLAFYYVFGICFMSRAICNIAFFSAIAYGFFLVAYSFFVEMQNYVVINRRVAGMPVKRIYGIATAMLSILLVVLALSVIPSVFLISQRRYTDIRTWFERQEITQEEWEMENPEQIDQPANTDMMEFFLREEREAKEMPFVVKVILWGISIGAMLALLGAMLQAIRKVFSDFRQTYDENGDKIEVIDDSSQEDTVTSRQRKLSEDPQAQKIRRQYKKMIRKHRKELPKEYETPTEMEEAAGLLEDDNMQQLHESYEQVRYGK